MADNSNGRPFFPPIHATIEVVHEDPKPVYEPMIKPDFNPPHSHWEAVREIAQNAADRIPVNVYGDISGANPAYPGVDSRFSGRAYEELDGVPHYQQFGFGSVPPDGVTGLCIRGMGTNELPMMVGHIDFQHRPLDLNVGDAMIYAAGTGGSPGVAGNKDGARVVVRTDGTVDLTSPSGSQITMHPDGSIDIQANGPVRLNAEGGSAKAARVGDNVAINDGWEAWLAGLAGAAAYATAMPATPLGSISTGSSTVDVGD